MTRYLSIEKYPDTTKAVALPQTTPYHTAVKMRPAIHTTWMRMIQIGHSAYRAGTIGIA